MLLHSLLRKLDPRISLDGVPDAVVGGVQEDSRLIRAGDLFVARGGTKTNGVRYIADAAGRGALAVVVGQRLDGCPLPQVVVSDAAAAVSLLANHFRGEPSRQLRVLGVTGTNGKTTTAYLVRHMLARAGQRCGLIGTVQVDDGRATRDAEMTTPSAVQVADLLAAMRDHGCQAVAMEVSSHALDQRRVEGVHFTAAAFTNLTGDHLDYHKTKASYAAAKARLFEGLDESAAAIVNARSRWSSRMIGDCKARVVRFGFSRRCDYRARDVAMTASGTHFILVTPDGQAEVHTRLLGQYNIENALAAAALVMEGMGLPAHQIAAALGDAPAPPGRLQAVCRGQPFAVLVDYAHTDDALANVLGALRPLTRGALRLVFGCGGDRDPYKRPRMARTAQKLADAIYVTSDNPRTEDPRAILEQIVKGFSAGLEKPVVVEADRRRAILRAIADAREGDVVVLAGKGHENYQIIGDVKHHFDDVEEAAAAIGRTRVGQ